MENLGKIAQGIFIGNGEVWNFLDYAVNRDCGGLMAYTRRNSFLHANIVNNYNSGADRPRYKYSEIPSSEGFAIDAIWGGTRIAPKANGGNIGDLYSITEEEYNPKYFITEEAFLNFERAIRANNTTSNPNTSYSEKRPQSYMFKIDDETDDTHLPSNSIGTYYNTLGFTEIRHKYSLEDFGNLAKSFMEKQTKNLLGDNEKYSNRQSSSKHPFRRDGYFTDEVKDRRQDISRTRKTLDDYAYDIRYNGDGDKFRPLYDYITQNSMILNANYEIPIKEWTIEDTDLFNVNIDTKKINILKYASEVGLKYYYKDYSSHLVGLKTPWSPSKVYGIESAINNKEYYEVDEENKFSGNVNISSSFNDGENSLYNPVADSRTYTYYQEKEKNKAPTAVNANGGISEGSAVMLSNYNGSSRLLQHTNKLFKEAKISSLINRFHTNGDKINKELTTAFDPIYGLSRGRNLTRKDGVDNSTGYENPYCRVWTVHHQYSQLKDRIRPFVDENGQPKTIDEMQSNYGALRPENGSQRLAKYSVLKEDGFVRMTPTNIDGEFSNKQNYMFSIENLAWKDVVTEDGNSSLSREQKGPNDGRIMWFPPYNLKFSENVNVNWNANTFIGRGEEIYTYTNTVRSGTLDFTLLIDHPSILNKWRGEQGKLEGIEKVEADKDILRFFAGCGNLNDVLKESKSNDDEEYTYDTLTTNTEPTPYTKSIAYVVFFPNNFSAQDYIPNRIDEAIDILKSYNTGGTENESDKSYEDQILKPWNSGSTGENFSNKKEDIKKNLFAGGDNIDDIKFFNDLLNINSNFNGETIFGTKATKCEILNVEVKGFASDHGKEQHNKELCNRRRTFIEKILQYKSSYFDVNNVTYVRKEGSVIPVLNIDGREDINTIDAKIARAAYVIVNIAWKEDNVTHEGNIADKGVTVNGLKLDIPKIHLNYKTNNTNIQTVTTVIDEKYSPDNEYLYFSEIKEGSLVHKHIVDKVKYFDPAFHSITPEGFNARLTFLHQCTRQGPTNAVSSGRVNSGSGDYLKFAGNLAFGRAPYCILRIGDFFHTKICIDSMSISYDNTGIQWDLNPEGVGVQPMYANISLSFKFLGGQDLAKPIERLQNAVTANYYANASVYDKHADNERYYYDALEDNVKYRNNKNLKSE